jgi:hypothetical protein
MERERERERKQHAATWVEEEPELQNQAGKLNIEITYCTPGLPCALFWYLSKWSSSSTMFLGLGCCVEMNGERWIFMWCQSTLWDFFHRCFLLYLTMGLELLLSEIWNLHSSIVTSHLKILQACFWRAVDREVEGLLDAISEVVWGDLVISIGCLALHAAIFYFSYFNEMSCNRRSFECGLIQCPIVCPSELIAGL